MRSIIILSICLGALTLPLVAASSFTGEVLGYYERIDGRDGVTVKISCSAERMLSTPAWNDDDAYPPLAPRYALNIAAANLQKYIISPAEWSLLALELRQEYFTKRWYYKVTYISNAKSSYPPRFGIYVLMDGSVVEPVEAHVSKVIEIDHLGENEGSYPFCSQEIAAAYNTYQEIVSGSTKADVTRIMGQPELMIQIESGASVWLYPLPLSGEHLLTPTRSIQVPDETKALTELRKSRSTKSYEQGFILIDFDEVQNPSGKHFESEDHTVAEALSEGPGGGRVGGTGLKNTLYE